VRAQADRKRRRPETDFMGKLVDVYPDGCESLVLPVIYPEGK